jgi:hypothetical protein
MMFATTRRSILARLNDGIRALTGPTIRSVSATLASSILSLARIESESAGAIDEVTPAGHQAMERVAALGQSIFVRGWAVDARAATLASRVVLLVDGVLGFEATYGHGRADIATVFGVPGYARAGFDAVLPPVLGLGAHNVAACAVSVDGRSFSIVAKADFHVIPSLIPRPFDAVANERRDGEITSVATDGDVRTPPQRAGRIELAFNAGVTVNGWAKPARGRYREVGIVVDDCWYLEGGQTGAGRTGTYQARFVLNFATPGDHELYAVAKTADRTFVRVSERIAFESIEPPLPWIWALTEFTQSTRAAIERVSAGTATLDAVPRGQAIFLQGWAVDEPAGATAGGVYVSVDGDRRSAVPARYGHPAYEHVAERCGFTATIPTDALSAGTHSLELLVTTHAWSGYYVPLPPLRFTISVPPSRRSDSRATA